MNSPLRSLLQACRTLLTLNCEEAAQRMSAAQDGPISRVDRWAVRLHLIGCAACRRFRRQLTLLHRAARRLGPQTPSEIELAAARQRLAVRLQDLDDN